MRQITRLCLLISIGIHLLLILLLKLPNEKAPTARVDEWDEHQAKGLVFELIEVPERVPREKPRDETNLVSDKETRAADLHAEDTHDSADPSSNGDMEIRQYEQPEVASVYEEALAAGTESAPPDLPGAGEDMEGVGPAMSGGRIDYLEEMRAGLPDQRSPRSTRYKNPSAGGARRGGFSFNTYNWDFAPYMLAMKRKVESNLRPPYAFTHMGAVSGTNIVRFIVLPDGRIRGLEILGSDAHFSLDQSSIRAIQLSAPFLPLPTGFPEAYLEVTAHFSYLIGGGE
jgi:TonB family protein